MPYKSYISISYDMNIYSDTQEVQRQEVKFCQFKESTYIPVKMYRKQCYT